MSSRLFALGFHELSWRLYCKSLIVRRAPIPKHLLDLHGVTLIVKRVHSAKSWILCFPFKSGIAQPPCDGLVRFLPLSMSDCVVGMFCKSRNSTMNNSYC